MGIYLIYSTSFCLLNISECIPVLNSSRWFVPKINNLRTLPYKLSLWRVNSRSYIRKTVYVWLNYNISLTSWISASDTGAELSTICGAAMPLGSGGRLVLILEDPLKIMFILMLKNKMYRVFYEHHNAHINALFMNQYFISYCLWWCLLQDDRILCHYIV